MSHVTSTKRPRAASLYGRDLYAWSLEQAQLLREGRLHEVDAENVAEEILDVGSNEYYKLESTLRVLLMHMLKWDHQPKKRTRSWETTIAVQRGQTLKQLRKTRALRPASKKQCATVIGPLALKPPARRTWTWRYSRQSALTTGARS